MSFNIGNKRAVHALNCTSYLSVGILGLYLAAYQYALADITEEFSLATWMSGLLIAAHFAASFFIPPIAGELSDRIGRKPVLIGMFLLMAAGISCAALSGNIWLLAFGALVTGGAANTIESSASSLLAQCNPERENQVMNLSQMYFCGGAFISPLYGALLKTLGFDWRAIYATAVVLCLICALLISRAALPEAPPKAPGLYFGRILRRPFYVLMLIAMLLYVGIEESAAFWSSSYAEAAGGGIESLLLSGYWLGMGLARLFASYLRKNIGRITLVGLALSCICFGSMLFLHTPVPLIIAYTLAGFTIAPAWPIIMVHAGLAGSDVPDTAAGGIMAAGSAGGVLIPFIMGLVQSAFSNSASFAVLAGVVVLETVLLATSKRFREI